MQIPPRSTRSMAARYTIIRWTRKFSDRAGSSTVRDHPIFFCDCRCSAMLRFLARAPFAFLGEAETQPLRVRTRRPLPVAKCADLRPVSWYPDLQNPPRSVPRKALKIGFVSLGCPKNLVDTEVMMGHLVAGGHELTPRPDEADVIVVNTCSFIDPAKQ